jgi:adenine-specific DNA-methyltransferase
MKKLKMHTPDMTVENIDKVATIFPNCLVETKDEKTGEVKRAIDFDQLRQELSDRIVDGPRERYHLDWPGKREALLAANAPIAKTLRPCREESVNFDTTKNLFIEGDNLDALKLLQETYLGKVKMIYIDPPYNTGNDFIYEDDFSDGIESYKLKTNQKNAGGQRLVANTESNGRFHSDWLSMIYPRLKIARNLLIENGIIFISIDENELSNLISLCCEIFGGGHLVGVFKWNKTSKAPTLSRKIRKKYEYVVCFEKFDCERLKGPSSYNEQAPLLNPANPVKKLCFAANKLKFGFPDGLYRGGTFGEGNKLVIIHQDVEVLNGTNAKSVEISARFKWSQETLNQRMEEGVEISFKTPKFSTIYYSLDNSNGKFIAPSDILSSDECGVLRNDEGFLELKEIFDGVELFDYCKPISLPKYLCSMVNSSDGIYLDFFSGSATTAHAVMQLNSEDGGQRRHIMVQLPDPCSKETSAYKVGYENIAEIGKERIRRAGAKIKAESVKTAPNLDIGFRVLKVDTSNMVDVYYSPDSVKQADLVAHTDNIKPERTPEDLLFQVLVDWGVDLSLPITQETVAKKKVFFVDGNALVACFDLKVSEDLVKELAKRKPLRAVFRDNSYDNDSVKMNVEQIFKLLSPETEVQTL